MGSQRAGHNWATEMNWLKEIGKRLHNDQGINLKRRYNNCKYICTHISSVQFSCSVMSNSATSWTAAWQAYLSITNSWSLLKLMSIKSVMPSNHLILCCPLLLLPSILPSIRVFSNESSLNECAPGPEEFGQQWSWNYNLWGNTELLHIAHFNRNYIFQLELGFPGGSSGKELTCQCKRRKRCGFHPWVGKIPWRKAWQSTLVLLPGRSHGQRSLVGYSPWGLKESNMTEHLTPHLLICVNSQRFPVDHLS